MYAFIKYLEFLWRSKNEHGVHSPFVYKLLTEGIYKKLDISTRQQLKAHREHLLGQQINIKVEDFGAGSRVFKTDHRSVARIAKVAGMPFKSQQLMAKMTAYFKPESMLELGTSVGLGTAAMHLGHPKGELITVERCPNTLDQAKKGFERFGWTAVKTQNSLFSDYLKSAGQKFDLIYLDGGHTKEFTLTTFKQLLPCLHNDSLLILDDIYWSKEMTAAWQEIKAHPTVTVTIDSYNWGWVFFRTQQLKEHFTLRV